MATAKIEREIKLLAKRVNYRMLKLERAGLADLSKEYSNIEHYAVDKNSPFYNVNTDKGTIRATQDLKRFKTDAELYRYKERLESILNAKTITIAGTEQAITKGYEKFKEKNLGDVSYDEYKNIFRIYKNKIVPNTKNHLSSDVVIDLIKNTNIYEMTDEQIEKALKYTQRYGVPVSTKTRRKKLKPNKTNGRWEFNL